MNRNTLLPWFQGTITGGLLSLVVLQIQAQPLELEPIEGRWSKEEAGLFEKQGFGGLFGGDRVYLEVPRGITFLSERLLQDFQADSLEDMLIFVPGTQGTAQFGHLTTPTMRGDTAETYIGGQRRSNNLFGYRPAMNAVESVEMVRGPATAVYGPGFHSGGYVNFRLKSPNLEENQTLLRTGSGGWAPDGSNWRDLTFQADFSQVLVSGKSGFRISYEGGGNETFMDSRAAAEDFHSLYGSYQWSGESHWEVSLSGELLWQNAPQLLGVNRPSPELVEEGHYFTGEGAFHDFGGGPVFVIVPPDSGPTQSRLPTGAGLISERDRSRAQVGWLQAELKRSGETVNFTNRSFFEVVDRERVHEFEYFEFVDQTTWENRSEWMFPWVWDTAEGTITTGGTLRWEERRSYVNFFNEVPFAFDLSTGATRFSIRERYPSLVVPGIAGPEGLEFFGLPFSPETTHSRLWNPALFFEGSAQPGPRWELLGGIRWDGYWARAADPITPQGAKDRLSTDAWSGFGSVIFAPGPIDRIYLTVADSNAVEGSIAGGGIMLNAEGRVNSANLRNRSRLLEMGWRRSLEDRATFGLTGFVQERKRLEIRGPHSDLKVRGIEADAVVEFTSGSYGFANVSWTRGDYRDSAPSQLGGRSLFDLYAPGTGPQGGGTGGGYDFFFLNQVPPGNYRIPGMSRFMGSAGWAWTLDRKWNPQVRAWGEYQSRQPGNLDGEYWIPAQYSGNMGFSLREERWRFSLQLLNVTNEKNWIHNGQTFFNNQLIFRSPPRRLEVELTVRY